MKNTAIAFDVDGTLLYYNGKPNKKVVDLLKNLYILGCEIYVWSAAGLEYADHAVRTLKLENYIAGVIPKDEKSASFNGIEVCFDDNEVDLCNVNIRINA